MKMIFNDIRLTEIHTAESVSRPNSSEVEISVEKLKNINRLVQMKF